MSTLLASAKPVEVRPIIRKNFGSQPTCENCYERDATYEAIFERGIALAKERYCESCLSQII